MTAVNLAEAKARLSDLVARAEAGESIKISRRGVPVVQLSSLAGSRRPINFPALRALTDSLPKASETDGDVVQMMRDGARY